MYGQHQDVSAHHRTQLGPAGREKKKQTLQNEDPLLIWFHLNITNLKFHVPAKSTSGSHNPN